MVPLATAETSEHSEHKGMAIDANADPGAAIVPRSLLELAEAEFVAVGEAVCVGLGDGFFLIDPGQEVRIKRPGWRPRGLQVAGVIEVEGVAVVEAVAVADADADADAEVGDEAGEGETGAAEATGFPAAPMA